MTQEYLKSILEYNEKTGVFIWKKKLSNRIKVGEVAGFKNSRYISISIQGKRYQAHRLAWFYTYGELPKYEIDHKDQDTQNNKISNLRDVTSRVNHQNKPKRRDNKSGISGVSWDNVSLKWVVRIKDNNGKYRNRGRFTSISEAERERDKALIEFGYSKSHGRELSRLQYRSK
jgi:hypothetical protein